MYVSQCSVLRELNCYLLYKCICNSFSAYTINILDSWSCRLLNSLELHINLMLLHTSLCPLQGNNHGHHLTYEDR